MIVDFGKGIHYLYRHIRLDKYEPFYVGIGTKSGEDAIKYNLYSRAFTDFERNDIWYNIVNHTEWKVEILFESNDYEFIKKKEIELIKLYGRIKFNTGTLANITEGGDGVKGWIPSEETRKKIGDANRGKKRSKEMIEAQTIKQYKPILQYDLDGNFIREWPSSKEAAIFYNSNNGDLCNACKGITLTYKGFIWRLKNSSNFIFEKRIVERFDINFNLEKIYSNVAEASRDIKVCKSSLQRFIKRDKDTKPIYGYYWRNRKIIISLIKPEIMDLATS